MVMDHHAYNCNLCILQKEIIIKLTKIKKADKQPKKAKPTKGLTTKQHFVHVIVTSTIPTMEPSFASNTNADDGMAWHHQKICV